jgi:hypothetical protein
MTELTYVHFSRFPLDRSVVGLAPASLRTLIIHTPGMLSEESWYVLARMPHIRSLSIEQAYDHSGPFSFPTSRRAIMTPRSRSS